MTLSRINSLWKFKSSTTEAWQCSASTSISLSGLEARGASPCMIASPGWAHPSSSNVKAILITAEKSVSIFLINHLQTTLRLCVDITGSFAIGIFFGGFFDIFTISCLEFSNNSIFASIDIASISDIIASLPAAVLNDVFKYWNICRDIIVPMLRNIYRALGCW